MKSYYSFSTPHKPKVSQVGGLGLSLIQMTHAGFNVPSGIILTANYFEPWFWSIKHSPQWLEMINTSTGDLKSRCDDLKAFILSLSLEYLQKQALSEALIQLQREATNQWLVIFPSPPEDGLLRKTYTRKDETVSGVNVDDLIIAIKNSFSSGYDESLIRQKIEQDLNLKETRIAVIIQELIPSEVSGIAFSQNLMTDRNNEVVIWANFGLGKMVRSGVVSSDEFVVEKYTGKILTKKLGAKQTSIWLDLLLGIFENPAKKRRSFSIRNKQVIRIASLVSEVEQISGKPIVIDWAYFNGDLYIQKIQPIPAIISLPKETNPRNIRKLKRIESALYKRKAPGFLFCVSH